MAHSMARRTAIVTCAAQGTGQAIARTFLEQGAQVMLADNDPAMPEIAAALAEECDAPPEDAAGFHFTNHDRLCIANLIAATLDRFERIDTLINVARVVTKPGSFLELEPEQFDISYGEKVRGVFLLSQAIAKRMIKQAEEESDSQAGPNRFAGAIVNISSIAAQRTVPQLLAFSVSCAALDQLTRSMAAALAGSGIRVNGVAVGSVLTETLRAALRETDELREQMVGVTPLGRLAEVDEVARVAAFLASEDASFVTGQIVAVDGGRTLLDPLNSPIR